MTSSSQARVHAALATHLGIEIEAIEDEQRTGRDLGLRALDLVLIALRLAARTPGRREFPVERIDPTMTVGDFGAVYRAWSQTAEPAEEDAPDTLRSARRPPASVRAGSHEAARVGR